MKRRIGLLAIFGLAVLGLGTFATGILSRADPHIRVVIDRSALDEPRIGPADAGLAPDAFGNSAHPDEALHEPAREARSNPVNGPRPVDPSLPEKPVQGGLPRKAENGDRPADPYAYPVSQSVMDSPRPKLAVIIMHAGISATRTADASYTLPAEAGFAISPYARDSERQSAEIRLRGHEVFLELQSVAARGAHEDRGPYAFDPAQSDDANRDRLYGAMSRMSGYAGVIADLTAEAFQHEVLASMLKRETSARGLFYFNFIRPDSQTFETEKRAAPERSLFNSVTLLSAAGPAELQPSLDRLLMRLNRERKQVVIVDPSSVVIDILRGFIADHDRRAFDLVPLTALMRHEGQG